MNIIKRGSALILVLSLFMSLFTGLFSASAMDLSQRYNVSWDYVLTDAENHSFTWYGGISPSSNAFGHSYSNSTHTIHDFTVKRNGLTTNKADWVYDQDYVYCFCIEPGVPLSNNTEYMGSDNSAHGDKWEKLSAAQHDLIKLALAYGYPNRQDIFTTADANACYAATQLIIWQISLGWRTSPASVNDQSYPMSGHTGTMTEQLTRNQYFKAYYDKILNDMANHKVVPSFMQNSPGNAPIYELTQDGNQYKIQLTDTNNVLSDYYVTDSAGLNISINGNTMTITSTSPITSEKTITLRRNMPSDNLTTGFLIWSVPGKESSNQDMVCGVDNIANSAYLKLKVSTGDLKIVKTSEDGVVENIPFTVTGNGINKTVRTTGTGEIIIPNLQAGIYTVTEGTIDRYEPQENRQVTVVSGGVATVTFNNKLKRGALQVIKSSEDNYNQGHTFRLSGTSLSGHAVDMYAVTDNQGVATFKDVLISGPTPYVLEEVDTAIRYVVPKNQTAIIKWKEVTKANFTNTLKKFRVTVKKKDSEFPYPQGDAKLNGAVYGLYNGSELVGSYTTDNNGQFTTDYYVCGDNWTIKEITASEGYLVDPTVYEVGAEAQLYTIEYNNAPDLISYETVKKGRVQIVKHTDDGSTKIETPEVGATFEIYLEQAGSYDAARPTERDILVIDDDGLAISKELPYGIYRVHQLSGWPGKEKMRDFLVYVHESERTYTYVINNSAITSKLKVEKRNAEDGELITAASIGFQIMKPDGSLLTQHIEYPTPVDVSTFYTNEEGWLMLPQELDFGYGYQLIEVQTAPGFYLSEEPIPFDVTGEANIITVTKYNMPQKAKIHITKNGEVFSSVTFTDGFYYPQYKVQSVAGGVYDIFADEDIYLNNKLMVRKDTRVAVLTTTASGATSPLLYLGRYRIEERQAPYSLITSGQVGSKSIELSYRGQTVEEYTENVAFYNDRQRVKISFEKIMEHDELYKIGIHGEATAVRMGLHADEAIVAADGTAIPKDGLMEIVTVDAATGYGEFTVDLPVGSRVYLKETATDHQYILSDQTFPLEFTYAGQDVPLVELTANNGDPIENNIKRGKIEGVKTDENGKGLAGVLIGLFTPDTTEYTEETALLTDISRENGAFCFEGVAYGEWVCREIATSDPRYVLNETVYPVKVSADKQIVKINIENEFVRGDIEGLKLDEDGHGLAGAIIGLFNPDEVEFTQDNAVMTAISSDNGSFIFEGVLYGEWLVREIAPPSASYVLSDTVYPIMISENKEIIRIEIENRYVRGSVRATKVDAEYPDNKLSGAVFDVFEDINGNREFDEDIDRFIGTLDEIEPGIYQLDGLMYSGYFLKERISPDLFPLDNY